MKKGVIDCENDTQCADDRACLDSIEAETRGRKLCERVCHEYRYYKMWQCHFVKNNSYIWEFLIIVLFISYTNISKYIRHRCDVPYSECKGADHKAECVCKKDFKGNGTVECIPEGFSQEENGRYYYLYVVSSCINILYVYIYRSQCNNLKSYFEIGKAYKMFDDQYMEFDNATQHCTNLGAR